jgi:hypothetical protein
MASSRPQGPEAETLRRFRKEVTLLDVAGRRVVHRTNITGTTHYLSVGQLAMGTYWVRVADGQHVKVKKLIIQ